MAGPTVATLGLSLQVPIAVTTDALLRDPQWLHHVLAGSLTLGGAVLVLGGVIGINLADNDVVELGEDVKATARSVPEESGVSGGRVW